MSKKTNFSLFIFLITTALLAFNYLPQTKESLALVPVIPGGETVTVVREDCTEYEADTCFTSLSAWEAAYGGIDFAAASCANGDLVCANTSAVAQIDGTWTNPDTAAVVIDGWNTSAANYIKIYTTAEARHDGKWKDGAYRLEIPEALSPRSAFGIAEEYVRVDGLQIRKGPITQYADNHGISLGAFETGEIHISHCIIRTIDNSNYSSSGIYFDKSTSGTCDIKIWNNIIYDFHNSDNDSCGINFYGYGNLYAFNNIIYNSDVCFSNIVVNSRTNDTKNNIAQNCVDGYYSYWSWDDSDYNVSDISGDAPNTGGSGNDNTTSPWYSGATAITDIFVDPNSDDFHLKADSIFVDEGTSFVSPINFTDDIDRDTRSGTWDIGADEADGTPPPACTETCKTNQCSDYIDCSSILGTCTTGYCCTGLCDTETTAPTNITNLSVSSCTSNSCSLAWTAPGDDNTTDTATTYDIRYSTANITDANWSSATQVSGESSPQVAGSSETHTVTGLTSEITYYFAIKTSDEVPNESGLSNIPTDTTLVASGLNISEVSSSSVSNGDSVVVSGSGFGATGPTIHKWDDFEGDTHIVEQTIGNGPVDQTAWTYRQADIDGYEPKISDSFPKTNSAKFVRCDWNDPDRWICIFYYSHGATLNPAYVTWYIRWDNYGTEEANNEKFWRIYHRDGSNWAAPYFSMARIGGDDAGINWIAAHGASSDQKWLTAPSENQWIRMEFYGEESTNDVTDGLIVLTQQISAGTAFTDMWNDNTQETRDNNQHWDELFWGSYVGGARQYIHDFDDIYIANSRARVEIGDNPSWDLCTHREIQPPTAWSTNSITSTANQGSFNEGDTAYLFVIDADGNTSNGYPITIGTAATPTISTTSLPNATANTPYTQTLQTTGGTTPYTYSITAGSLPTGLSLNASTGVIFGTPTVAETANFTIQVADSDTNTDTQALSITVEVADTTAPTGSVSINNGETITNSQDASLSLSASDSSGVTEMKISNTNDFNAAILYTYNTVRSWVLATGDGLKTVYAWFKDSVGNWNISPYTDTISLDTTSPAISNITSSNITTNSVQINFNTSENTTSYLEYGLTTSYGNQTTPNSSGIMNYEL